VTEYEHQLALHDELRALLEQIRDGKAYFRNPAALNIPNPPVVGPKRAIDRDRLLCAMFNRLATTHTAVRRLAELGFGDDAFALCRNMIENAIYLMWILQDTGVIRKNSVPLKIVTLEDLDFREIEFSSEAGHCFRPGLNG
jgi:hypothetical protein